MKNPTHSFREMNLRAHKRKKRAFLYCLFGPKEIFLTFVFLLNVQCIEYTFRIYVLLHIKKLYFINFCYLFLKSSKAFNVSLCHNMSETQFIMHYLQIIISTKILLLLYTTNKPFLYIQPTLKFYNHELHIILKKQQKQTWPNMPNLKQANN